MKSIPLLAAALLIATSTAARPQDAATELRVPGSADVLRLLRAEGTASDAGESVRVQYSRDLGKTWSETYRFGTALQLRFARFDPAEGAPGIDERLLAVGGSQLHIVQLVASPTSSLLEHLRRVGGTWHQPMPDLSYVVRASVHELAALSSSAFVRATTPLHPAYKLDERLLAALLYDRALPKQRYDVLLVDPQEDRAGLLHWVETQLGGRVANANEGNILVDLELSKSQVYALAQRDEVLWIEQGSEPEDDMDIVRWMGGADVVEPLGGTGGKYTGKGVRGHIMEGIYNTHPEYNNTSPYRIQPWSVPVGNTTADNPSSHGNSTFSISFAYGARAQARGLVPDGQGMFTNYNYVYNNSNRLSLNQLLTDPSKQHKAMYQTASWGYTRTTQYTLRSAEMDRIIFDVDLPTTQSQSNAGATSQPRDSRPQAWAKNIISVGAVRHYGNKNIADDKWANGGSTGPASDGRIKPDLCGYYDGIYAASGATTYTTSFGGTSGATPIVAGHLGFSLELWTDGLWGYPMQAGGWQNRFANRPHFTTSKAMLINTAYQYDLSAQATRYQQGWGFPQVDDLYETRKTMLVVNEQDVLQARQTKSYWVWVPFGSPMFKATMTYADIEGTVNVTTPHRVNDLDLRCFAPNGQAFWGNQGLTSSHWSSAGGSADGLNTVENVFVAKPVPGLWRVEVGARVVLMDTHPETRAVDADFALVVSGIGGMRDTGDVVCKATKQTNGNVTVALGNLPAGYKLGYTVFTFDRSRPTGHGAALGIQWDSFSSVSFQSPIVAGNPFAFLPSSQRVYPNVPFVIPAALVKQLAAAKIPGVDVIGIIVDGKGRLRVSNVARVDF
jgi:hypothetical protein